MDGDERVFEGLRRIRRSPLWALLWGAAFFLACSGVVRATGFEGVLNAMLAVVFLWNFVVTLQRWRDTRRGA